MKKFLRLGFLPESTNAGLLLLRLTVCLSLFLKHGTEKLFNFSGMAAHFPNLLHLGSITGLSFATLSDGICTLLIIVGFATRWASLISFINIFAAWALVHHFVFFGRGSDHGELIVLYLASLLTIFIAGPGLFSIDAQFLAGSAGNA
ncbi:MAG TPA: DoxX family protein [Terracidiphilus sp.]|nr:DoxX family protein [Terracidiphilus sp.]